MIRLMLIKMNMREEINGQFPERKAFFFFLMGSSFTISSFIQHLNILEVIQIMLKKKRSCMSNTLGLRFY